MVAGGVVLGKVVGQVVSSAAPVDEELALVDAVSDPVKAHVNGFGAALLHCVVGDPGGAGVICLDGSGLLRMAHAVESGSKHCAVLSIVKQSTQLGFHGGR